MSDRIVRSPKLARKGICERYQLPITIIVAWPRYRHTWEAFGEAQRYTPGSTVENNGGTWISDGPENFDMAGRLAA